MDAHNGDQADERQRRQVPAPQAAAAPGSPAAPAGPAAPAAQSDPKEQAFARRLGAAFDKIGTPAAGDCPDPEQIAAWRAHTLTPEESARCEAHFASCPRCRKILAVLAASGVDEPLKEDEIAHLGGAAAAKSPAEASSASAPHPIRSTRPRWLVPLLSVAAVLLLVLITRPLWHSSRAASGQTQVAQAQAPPAPNNTSGDISAAGEVPGVPNDSGTPNETPLPAANPALPEAPGRQAPTTKAQAEVDNLLRESSDYSPPDNSANAAQVAGLRTPGALAGNASQAIGGAAASSQGSAQGNSPSGSQAGRPASPAPTPAAAFRASIAQPAQQPAARTASPLAAIASTNVGNFVVLRAPGSMVAWRAGTAGRIERSTDSGRTWQMQQSPLKNDWLAGSMVSGSICWLVGRNDAVARTTDGGQNWEPITTPSVAGNSGARPDWVAVSATDADNATLTTRDRQRYVTHDGGHTWEMQ